MTDREFWIAVRQALLMMIDALERKLAISPTTSALRKKGKNTNYVITLTPEGSVKPEIP